MTDAARRRPAWLGAVLTLAGVAILVWLGTWQMRRLAWKEDLLARIEALQAAPPRGLAEALAGDPDFVRARIDCPGLETAPTLSLYTLRDGRPGRRLIAACPVEAPGAGSILVDRGFVPEEAPAPGPGRAVLPEPAVGVLRRPEGPNFATPPNDPAAGLWHWRDVPAMAAALGAERPAPVVLMLESPAPEAGGPEPAPLPPTIANRHLEYALTWFGLAATLVGVYVAMLLRKRRS